MKEYFKDAVILECVETGKSFLYVEDYCVNFLDWSNIALGKPTVKRVQKVMGGVLFKEPNQYAKIIKTKEEVNKYMKQ